MGYAFNGDADIMLYLAYGFIFLLSMMLIPGVPGGLDYVNATNTEYTYANDTSLFTTSEVPEYDTYKNFIFGFYLSLFSLFGFISVFMKRQNVDFGDSL